MYLPKEITDDYWVVDVEGNSLSPTKLWCVVFKHVNSGETKVFAGPDNFRDDVRRFLNESIPNARLVGHNIVSFDAPALRRLCMATVRNSRLVDTLILSTLYHPKIPLPEGYKGGSGPHSLDAYGFRFGIQKNGYDDFSCYSDQLLDRCIVDVDITARLFKALVRKMRSVGFSEKSCELEHQIRFVVNQQEDRGFHFDLHGASVLFATLRQREQEIEDLVRDTFPPTLVSQGVFKRRVKKDGTPYSTRTRHEAAFAKIVDRDDGTYEGFSYEDFNIGSPSQRVERLLNIGFQPTKFTDKGNPKIDEETLLEFAKEKDSKEVNMIAEWLVVNGRANMINTWMDCYNHDTQAIHGSVWTCGAGTRRMTHSSPNTANIPSNEAKFGKECRSLWQPRPGLVLVGYDAAAAQMRLFAHYLPDPTQGAKYYDKSICQDPHQLNADLIGVTRKIVKNVFYANLFGAGPPKLATTAGYGGNDLARYGKWIRDELYRTTPGLKDATDDAQREFFATPEHWIACVDGGYVRCPAVNAALNYRIQSAEACLMKQASVFIWQRTAERGIEDYKVGDIHDEGQHETIPEDVSELKKIMCESLRDAGEELNLRVPIAGDAREGKSWAQTH